MSACHCILTHAPKRIVITGGPGAGKTAVLELVRKALCKHIRILPEAAGILFGGGFPRGSTPELRKPAQRAIFHVQRELEATGDLGTPAIVLCDRGTVDGLGYWPGPEDFFASVGTTLPDELARYHAVVHLRTPAPDNGYNHMNPLRVETPVEAAAIDERIAVAWQAHPRRFVIPASPDFIAKASSAIELIAGELPACCAGAARTTAQTLASRMLLSRA